MTWAGAAKVRGDHIVEDALFKTDPCLPRLIAALFSVYSQPRIQSDKRIKKM